MRRLCNQRGIETIEWILIAAMVMGIVVAVFVRLEIALTAVLNGVVSSISAPQADDGPTCFERGPLVICEH